MGVRSDGLSALPVRKKQPLLRSGLSLYPISYRNSFPPHLLIGRLQVYNSVITRHRLRIDGDSEVDPPDGPIMFELGKYGMLPWTHKNNAHSNFRPSHVLFRVLARVCFLSAPG